MADIFLSYASTNRGLAGQLVEWLEACGWSVFWDDHLKVGHRFDMQLEKQLESAGCVIVVWTRDSVNRSWPRSEAARAQRRGKLIQVLLEEVELPLEFDHIEYINAVGRHSKDWLKQLHGEISKLVAAPKPLVEREWLDEDLDYANLFSATPSQLRSAIERLALLAKGGINRSTAFQRLGVCHLLLAEYDKAKENLQASLSEDPDLSTSHYFMAHALLSGRLPRQLSFTDVKVIEQSLEKSTRLPNPPKEAFQMAAYLKYDYYLRNGLLARPSPSELVEQSTSAVGIVGESARLATLFGANSDEAVREFFSK